MIDMILT